MHRSKTSKRYDYKIFKEHIVPAGQEYFFRKAPPLELEQT